MTQASSVVRRRTFEARRHPSGSPERARLNENPVTSEYMPSKLYAYVLAHPATGARCSGSGVTRYRVEAEVEKLLAQGWRDAHEDAAVASETTTASKRYSVVIYETGGELRVGQVMATIGPTLRVHGPQGIEQIPPAAILRPGDPRAEDIDHLAFKCEDFERGEPIGPVTVERKSEVGKLRLKRFTAEDIPAAPWWASASEFAALVEEFGLPWAD